MKDLDTMIVSSAGQSTLPIGWREVSGPSPGGWVEVRPLRGGKQRIVLTPRTAPAGERQEQL